MKSIFNKLPGMSFRVYDDEQEVINFDHLLKLCLFQESNDINIYHYWKNEDGFFGYNETIDHTIFLDLFTYKFNSGIDSDGIEELSKERFINKEFRVTYCNRVDFSKLLIKNIKISPDVDYLISPRYEKIKLSENYTACPSDILIITNVNSDYTALTVINRHGDSFTLNQKDIINYWDIHPMDKL